ncbi:uncharacterized protein VTP21DRAFT_3182 [Calcarisporiella thermophila]|uniref:uncharacterized protein n=1 Tax=Calcarisporiella thermophila TaxID=911321 RepID=UPI003742C6B6
MFSFSDSVAKPISMSRGRQKRLQRAMVLAQGNNTGGETMVKNTPVPDTSLPKNLHLLQVWTTRSEGVDGLVLRAEVGAELGIESLGKLLDNVAQGKYALWKAASRLKPYAIKAWTSSQEAHPPSESIPHRVKPPRVVSSRHAASLFGCLPRHASVGWGNAYHLVRWACKTGAAMMASERRIQAGPDGDGFVDHLIHEAAVLYTTLDEELRPIARTWYNGMCSAITALAGLQGRCIRVEGGYRSFVRTVLSLEPEIRSGGHAHCLHCEALVCRKRAANRLRRKLEYAVQQGGLLLCGTDTELALLVAWPNNPAGLLRAIGAARGTNNTFIDVQDPTLYGRTPAYGSRPIIPLWVDGNARSLAIYYGRLKWNGVFCRLDILVQSNPVIQGEAPLARTWKAKTVRSLISLWRMRGDDVFGVGFPKASCWPSHSRRLEAVRLPMQPFQQRDDGEASVALLRLSHVVRGQCGTSDAAAVLYCHANALAHLIVTVACSYGHSTALFGRTNDAALYIGLASLAEGRFHFLVEL